MSKSIVIAAVLLSLLVTPLPARAADNKIVAGSLLTLGGGLLMVAAFDYTSKCPDGYTTHTFQNLPTQCVYVDRFGSDVIEQPTKVSYERPVLMKSGIAAAALGVVVLMVPRKVQQQAPSIAVTSSGWRAWKTFIF